MDAAYPLATALLARDDVTGVFRASKRWRNGAWEIEDCIAVAVKKKKSPSDLTADELIPSIIGGIPTDVIELHVVPSLYSLTYAPVCGGISISNTVSESSGTLGGVFHDDTNNVLCGLTNFHVLAAGDTPMVPDTYVVHPSSEDGGLTDAAGRIGKTTRWQIDEWADAAIFTLTKQAALSMLTSHVVLSGTAVPELGDTLEKSGRSTGITEGEVTYSGLVLIDYTEYGYGEIIMNMVGISPLSDPDEEIAAGGDSGAVWYDQTTHEGKGLHTAHMTDPYLALAAILPYVLEDLNCSVVTPDEIEHALSGSCSLGVSTELAAAGSMNLVQGGGVLATKVFAVDDWERKYTSANFEQWVQDLGYDDEESFLAAFNCEDRDEWFAGFGDQYEDLDEFLATQTLETLRDIMANNGITL